MYSHLPGGDILEKGLKDLRIGARTIDALLLLIAGPRLSRCGIPVPPANPPIPEHELYQQLTLKYGPEAYRHYRSLLQRLVSLENALEIQRTALSPSKGQAT